MVARRAAQRWVARAVTGEVTLELRRGKGMVLDVADPNAPKLLRSEHLWQVGDAAVGEVVLDDLVPQPPARGTR